MTPTKGDRFMHIHPKSPDPLFIEVTRVARDASWADIKCCTWAAMWTKRQPLPLPEHTYPTPWTWETVLSYAPADVREVQW